MNDQSVIEIIKLLWPLILIQLVLAIAVIIDIAKKKKTRNLSPTIWIIIAIVFELLGSVAYFVFGRAED